MKFFSLNEIEKANNHAKANICFVLIILITFIDRIQSLNSSDSFSNDIDYAKDETLSLLAPTYSNECKSDAHCVDAKFCLNGTCVNTCHNGDTAENCVYFHCDSKQLVTNDSRTLIETNNYPQLTSYFTNQKCSWLLKSQHRREKSSQVNSSSLPFIELSFERFSTLHASDYLYIFDGDSIYSPMIAALSGDQISNVNPSPSKLSLSSFLQKDIHDNDKVLMSGGSISRIKLLNQSSLFLLFKSDVTPLYSSLNSFASLTSQHQSSYYEINDHKPSGIAIKYKIANYNDAQNETRIDVEEQKLHDCLSCQESLKHKSFSQIFEQVVYENDVASSKQNINSSLRRALFCSFRLDDYFYVVGGYSFRKINFMVRLDLVSMKWDQSPDQNPSAIHNRSNRRFYSNLNYKQPTLNLPQSRYSHSCVVDKNQFFMYGGIKYEIGEENLINKETTNELWSYHFETNKWSLLNPMAKDSFLKNYILPLSVSGHSMHLITKYGNFNEQPNKCLLIFFGYSEYYGSTLSIIQEYNLASKSWSLYNISNINIGFSHSSFHDPVTNLIYFHGGVLLNTFVDTNEDFSSSFPSTSKTSSSSLFNLFDSFGFKSMRQWPSSSSYTSYTSSNRLKQIQTPILSPMLYTFNAENFEWTQLAKTTISSYMQSMIHYENHLIVYGGITINEETLSVPYKSNQLRIFSIRNNKWLKKIELNKKLSLEFGLEEKTLTSAVKFSKHERMGHSSFLYNSSLFTFGGFNGFFLNDLSKFNLKLFDLDNFNFFLEKKKKRKRRQLGKLMSGSDDGPTISGGPTVKFKSFKFQSYLNQQSSSSAMRGSGIGGSSSFHQQYYSDEDIFGNKIPSKSSSASYFYDYISNNHDQPIDFLAIYDPKSNMKQSIESCTKYKNCQSCHLDPKCVWNLKTCEKFSVLNFKSNVTSNNVTTLGESGLETNFTQESVVYMKPTCSQTCDEYKSCSNCTLSNSRYKNDCVWCASQLKCILASSLTILDPFGECVNLITKRNECERSVTNVGLNVAHSIKTTVSSKKFWPSSSDNYYYQGFCEINHSNCSSCISDERCGWCSSDAYDFFDIKNNSNQSVLLNYSLNTGFGTCMEGGESFSQGDRCKLNWFFIKCPSCECNGHSTCSKMFNITSLNDSSSFMLTDSKYNSYAVTNEMYLPYTSMCGECLNNTEGEYCSRCKDGYFGNPKNNGFCAECDCGVQASLCDNSNGKCFCNTKGVIGHKCDQCDAPRYLGRPNLDGGSCFYNLTTDYQFTFNLNKDSDRYYTQINFVNHPMSGSDDDIDFMVRCIRENALINITYILQGHNSESRSLSSTTPTTISSNTFDLSNMSNSRILKFNWSDPNTSPTYSPISHYNFASSSFSSTQMKLLTQINCTGGEFKYTFNNRDLNYASRDKNPIFVVNVYAFQTPITIQIAFSRRSRVQLLHFFITFFGCLLSLLTIAFITWKSKQRYDRFRRQRQIVIQMEHMASRPFTRLIVDITKKNDDVHDVNNEEKINLIEGKCTFETDVKQLNQSFFISSDFKTRKSSKRKLKKFMENRKHSFTNGSLKERLTTSKETAAATTAGSAGATATSQSLKIMPVAIEPLSNNKTGILTCLLKLPQGDLNYTPKGSSPFMLASAYVQINQNSPFINVPQMLANKNEADDFLNEKLETKTEI